MRSEQFSGLFEDHYAAVLGYGLRRVDPDTARDMAAETFLVAWRRLEEPPQMPRPWLLAVARRVLANELRRQGREERLVNRIGQETLIDGGALVAPDQAAPELGGVVGPAMATLSAPDQELLQLIGWEHLDRQAAAQVLGCSVPALKVRLHRARRRLEAALKSGPEPGLGGTQPRFTATALESSRSVPASNPKEVGL